MKIREVVLATACALVAGTCFANVPGGGTGTGPNVSYKDLGDSVVLDNGIVSIRINKKDASIRSFAYQGENLLAGGHGG
ncbi:hypothetical protein NL317_28985, partial [Klebsiella pneumoniae]|nr:hypothetical protein [Klebsiella pneumoniae]